ncbi:MAG: Pro-sigmaK processing inhibitor BofA [Dorea sp.]|jgi:pro-sigmaK processing inhibitor BofA|nr:Pro-sigmaK processing inhibitor BofA [Dorea sp.]
MSEGRPGIIVNFLVRALIGMALIFFVNEFLSSRGINAAVGLNAVTFLTSGTLGIPGVALLYGIVFYRIL